MRSLIGLLGGYTILVCGNSLLTTLISLRMLHDERTALAVGLVHGLTAAFEPAASEAAIFILMALALLLRPRGLLGARDEKRA